MFLDKYRSVGKSKERNELDKDAPSEAIEVDQKKPPKKIVKKQTKKKVCRKNSPSPEQKQVTGNNAQKVNSREAMQQRQIDLIRRCASDSATRRDWKEFNNEFTPLITTRIEKTLIRMGFFSEKITDAIADEIDEILTEKLCDGKTMKIIAGYENPTGGLLQTAANVVISWGRKQNEISNAHNAHIKANIKQLSTPLGEEEDDGTLMDITPDPATNPLRSSEEEARHENIVRLIQDVESLSDIEKRLAFKINIMFYKPLTDDDVAEIAALKGKTPSEIDNQLDAIMARLADENEEIEKKQDNLANKFTDLQKLISQLAEKKKDFNTPESKLRQLERDIARKKKLQKNLIKRNQKISVYPSMEEVAKLLNIRKEKKKDISVWLSRIREALEKYKALS